MSKLFNVLSLSITILLPFFGLSQQNTQVFKKIIKGWEVETGYFVNGQPYAKVGKGDKVLVYIEELSFDHKPPEGFLLNLFVQQTKTFYDDYTVYRIGRKPNLPKGYSIDLMSKDYGLLITNEFNFKVDVIGASTGGQIGLCLAANFPEIINKAVIISAAYRLGEKGKEIEKKVAKYFSQEKYGKTMATLIEVVYNKGFKRFFYKTMMRIMGRNMLKDIEYPSDFQVEVMADCNMNFINRLKEIKVSTLIISGEKDAGYLIEDVKTTAEGIENSKIKIYEKYGHNLFSDNYKEVNIDIAAFLNQEH